MAYPSDLPATLSVQEAADYLGVTRRAVYEYCRQNYLRSFRIGSRVFIPREAILEKIGGKGEDDGQGV